VLSFTGLEEWVLTAERIDIVSANKEGLCSLIGYAAIFFFGSALGSILLTQRKMTIVDWKRLLRNLCLLDLILWTVYAVAHFYGIQTSRRLVHFLILSLTNVDECNVRVVFGGI
jgi:hypothetical protein